MGCTTCGSNKNIGKSKSSMSKKINGVSKAKTFSTSNINTYGKPRITFSAKNR